MQGTIFVFAQRVLHETFFLSLLRKVIYLGCEVFICSIPKYKDA